VAPVGVGVASPNSPSATNKAFAGHSPVARSEFQEAVKSVAVHDPTGAAWQLYDNCIVLPDAKAFRDRMTTELITGAREDFRSGLELKVGQADALLAAPYADLCMDAFAWAAASDDVDTLYRRGLFVQG
jgi:hypothetical protein